MSEPPAEACNTRPRQPAYSGWLDILAFIVALVSIAISVYATGIDSRCFSLRPGCQDKETAVTERFPTDMASSISCPLQVQCTRL
ncbi:unnamed protein product [Closterium sp. NIES-65]|nr:unnamed protein product [Closterium sp. NIES-65]